MKKLARSAALVTLVLAAAACSGVKYHTDYDTGIDFTKYQTFAWHPSGSEVPDDPRFNGEIIARRIERSTEKALVAKHLSRVDSPAEADLVVAFHAAVDGRITATQVNSYYGYDIFWGGYAWATSYQGYYDQGTVVLDVLENAPGDRDKLVYRGYATGGIEEKPREPEDMDRRMDGIMADILADWPAR